MSIDIVKLTAKYTILLGLIGLVLVWAFGLNNSFVQTQYINGIEIKTFDWFKWSGNMTNIWSTDALDMSTIIPPRQWDDTASWTNWDGLFNNIAYVFDWLYFPLNFIAYILRWITWVIRLGLGLIGWDFTMTNGDYNSVLVKILTWITENFVIPYI